MSHATQTPAVQGGSATGQAHQPHESMLWSMLTITAEPDSRCRDVGDEIVRHIIAPLSAQGQVWGGYRFNFSRKLETNTPAVHLHLRATDDVVERVWKFAHALAEENAPKLGAVKISRSPNVAYPPRPGEVATDLMEAAFARYGGPEGMKLVGDVSELSADLALWAVNRFPRPNMRSTLAALLLFDTAHAMMRGPRSAVWRDRRTTSWDYYWNAHLQTCTASFGPHAEHARRAMKARMAPRIVPAHRVMAALASEPSVELWRRRWAQAIDMYLYRADKQRISRGAQQLAVAASGLLINRLGIPLREEAALGLYARAWNADIEAKLCGKER